MNHLFSFFPEKGSIMENHPQPSWSTYLRIQLARYLIENSQSGFRDMEFDEQGRVMDFGIDRNSLMEVINLGIPFMTTGCHDSQGEVACNRPFGNCLPDVQQWNYPYEPNIEEIDQIKRGIFSLKSI
jgi:biotin synthase